MTKTEKENQKKLKERKSEKLAPSFFFLFDETGGNNLELNILRFYGNEILKTIIVIIFKNQTF